MIDPLLRFARVAWRRATPPSIRSALHPLVVNLMERRAFAAASTPELQPVAGPVVLSGFLRNSKGISQAARLTLAALEQGGFRPVAHDLGLVLTGGAHERRRLPTSLPGGVWLVHCNAPEAIMAMAVMDKESWRGRYRIGYWAYELPSIPASWVRAARLFHEIWAPSTFVAASLRRSGVTQPIRVMPHPAALAPQEVSPDRRRFGVPQDAFCVLAMGDLLSSVTRKNLAGAIDIYRRAFPVADGRTCLIVKVLGDPSYTAFTRSAEAIIGDRKDIRLLMEDLPGAVVQQLIASADVLLSPHRAEGFGLTLAEALMMGVPPLATGWSGNMDFMSSLPELQIRYEMTPVRDPAGVYFGPGLQWADPDPEDAANKLKALAQSADLRRRLVLDGRRVLESQSRQWTSDCLRKTALGHWASGSGGR